MHDVRARGAVLALLCLAFVFGPMAGSARALAPATTGWWTSLPAGPLGQSAGPDVPPDGMLIQAGSSAAEPTAYGALRYELPADQVASSLTLRVAPNSVSTADAVTICALQVETFEGSQGGPITDAPGYDCSQGVSVVQASGTYVADLTRTALRGAGGVLAVAVVPASSTGRVVLERPDAGSLQTVDSPTRPPTASGGEDDPNGSVAVGSSPFDTTPMLGADGFFVGSPGVSSLGPVNGFSSDSTSGDSSALQDSDQEMADSTSAQAIGSTGARRESSWAPLGFLALALTAIGTWLMAGRSAALGAAGRAVGGTTGDDPYAGTAGGS